MNRFVAIATVLLAVGAFLAGWNARSHRAERDLARIHERHTTALNQALAEVRAIEQRRISDMETLHHDTQAQLDAITAAEHRVADERVRNIAAQYAARHRAAAADSAAASQCEAAVTATDVLAELLGDLDTLAQDYAAEADRRRIAGLACEAAWERLRADTP